MKEERQVKNKGKERIEEEFLTLKLDKDDAIHREQQTQKDKSRRTEQILKIRVQKNYPELKKKKETKIKEGLKHVLQRNTAYKKY